MFFISLSEVNELQVQLASAVGIVDQFEGCLLTPSLSQYPRSNVVCCIENLAYNPHTHQHIVKPQLVRALIKSCHLPIVPVPLPGMDIELCKKLEFELSR